MLGREGDAGWYCRVERSGKTLIKWTLFYVEQVMRSSSARAHTALAMIGLSEYRN